MELGQRHAHQAEAGAEPQVTEVILHQLLHRVVRQPFVRGQRDESTAVPCAQSAPERARPKRPARIHAQRADEGVAQTVRRAVACDAIPLDAVQPMFRARPHCAIAILREAIDVVERKPFVGREAREVRAVETFDARRARAAPEPAFAIRKQRSGAAFGADALHLTFTHHTAQLPVKSPGPHTARPRGHHGCGQVKRRSRSPHAQRLKPSVGETMQRPPHHVYHQCAVVRLGQAGSVETLQSVGSIIDSHPPLAQPEEPARVRADPHVAIRVLHESQRTIALQSLLRTNLSNPTFAHTESVGPAVRAHPYVAIRGQIKTRAKLVPEVGDARPHAIGQHEQSLSPG